MLCTQEYFISFFICSLAFNQWYKLLIFIHNYISGSTLQKHCTENSKQIFSEMKLRCFVSNFYIRVFLSELYISTIGSHILLQQNRWTDRGINEWGNWERGCAVSFLGIHKSDLVDSAAQFSI